jgi:hypothetical protein
MTIIGSQAKCEFTTEKKKTRNRKQHIPSWRAGRRCLWPGAILRAARRTLRQPLVRRLRVPAGVANKVGETKCKIRNKMFNNSTYEKKD